MKHERFFGSLIHGDFDNKTITFRIDSEMILQAGKYVIQTEDDYNKLVSDADSEQKALHINSVRTRNSDPNPPCSTCENAKYHTERTRCNKKFTDSVNKYGRELYYMQWCMYSLL